MMQVTRPTRRVKHIMVMCYQSILVQLPGAVGNINMYLSKEVCNQNIWLLDRLVVLFAGSDFYWLRWD
jgi:hypothetical protein